MRGSSEGWAAGSRDQLWIPPSLSLESRVVMRQWPGPCREPWIAPALITALSGPHWPSLAAAANFQPINHAELMRNKLVTWSDSWAGAQYTAPGTSCFMGSLAGMLIKPLYISSHYSILTCHKESLKARMRMKGFKILLAGPRNS